jgi:hypothetical protein
MSNDTIGTGRGPRRESAKEKFWRTALAELAASGQSVRAFCRDRDLSEPSLYAWRRTIARRDAARSAVAADGPHTPALLPIRLMRTTAPSPIQILLAGGHRIRLRPPVDREALTQVLAALEGKPSTALPSASVAPQAPEA